ncbi:hypothetical protein DFJ77DRAFT_463850 [Powellomyces hirtus]|nr:hypothetical protein DFJ77DRAFT_463850 [Powellomyces hirtus]
MEGGKAAEEGVGGRPEFFRSINNETTATERQDLYLSGGVLSVTSRILVVDMLNKIVPVNKILGIIVNHAHRVTDTSTEAFILRLYRDDNKEGFIKALSDEPEAFTRGYWKLERSMKTLFLRHVFLWPRFHMTVMNNIEQGKVELHECKVKLTQSMKEIQAALIDCIDQCLAELRRTNPTIDAEELTVENAFFRTFDQLLRSQLDPIWHRVGQKTKLLIGDLKVLRRLLSYLISYDCVTFNSFLETIVATNATDAGVVFRSEANQSPWLLLDSAHVVLSAARQRVYRRVAPSATGEAAAPHVLSNDATGDVVMPPGLVPVLEEQPKWRVLRDVIRQIERDRAERQNNGEVPGPVLVMVDGDRACNQLSEILSKCDLTYIKPEPGESVPPQQPAAARRSKPKSRKRATLAEDDDGEDEKPSRQQPDDAAMPSAGDSSGTGSEQLLSRLLQRYFRWKGGMAVVTKNLFRGNRNTTGSGSGTNGASNGNNSTSTSYTARGRGGGASGQPPAAKRRRVRGSSTSASSTGRAQQQSTGGIGDTGMPVTFEQEAEQIAEYLSQVETVLPGAEADMPGKDKEDPLIANAGATTAASFLPSFTVIESPNLVTVRPYASTSMALAGGSVSNGDDDARVLEDLMPEYVVLYDPDLGFVRRVECYKALNPHRKLRVYFLVYENSVEEQRFLSMIRKEKAAFEKLIREKSIMAIPIDQDGRIARDPEAEFWRQLDSRLAGGQIIAAKDRNQVIVDVREFRSSLPLLLHTTGLSIRACTLEVGDYVLSPSICVERKSLSDLIQSLKSGRLYTQCEAMSLHYKTPVLLIEFDKQKSGFALHSEVGARNNEIDARDVGSRLCLLCLHFVKLRIVWSSSPQATAEIFEDLKKNQEEPSMEDAMAVGVDNADTIDSAYSITPSDILRSLPGITSKNYRYVMSKVRDLRELSQMTLQECQALIGSEFGRLLHEFFRKDAKDERTL